jgi:RNA polymerase sigma-70 factor (ECF subfamily)
MLHGREPPGEASVRAADVVADPVALMGRYCDGDRRAFDQIYATLAPRILGYLTALAKDRATAEDLLQQTFIKLHQHRDVYVRGANPVPWLFTIAHRTFLDEARRRRRSRVRNTVDGTLSDRASGGLEGSMGAFDGAFDGAFGADAGTHDSHIARSMAALASLPESQRQAVQLIKLEGRTTAEAATMLGTTVGAIKVRAHRGYVALRRKLKIAPEDDGDRF